MLGSLPCVVTCNIGTYLYHMYLTPSAPLCAMRGSCQVVLNGTPTHEPSTLVGSTNSGLLAHGALEGNTRTRNCSGTLLRGIVSLGEAKSSICKATAYQPLEPVAAYRRVHCNTEDNSYNKCVMEQHSRV